MAGTFSDEAMRAMGFQQLSEGQVIVATFTSITVFEARGIVLDPAVVETAHGSCAGTQYNIAVASSVNAACQELLSDVYVDDEEQWRKDRKCSGPFVLVSVGPTEECTCETGWHKVETNGSITTYDAFPALSGVLSRREDLILPRVRSALSCVMNEGDLSVALQRIERSSSGVTKQGITIHNLRLESHVQGYVSRRLDQAVLRERLAESMRLACTLNPKASGLFALGLGEADEFKKFMYFFLALEIETHAIFGKIDQTASLQQLLSDSEVTKESTFRLLEQQAKQLRNLFDRFVWCATFAWSNVTDADVDQFRSLKQARDDIAHGTISQPPVGYADLAERLAHKVLWERTSACHPPPEQTT